VKGPLHFSLNMVNPGRQTAETNCMHCTWHNGWPSDCNCPALCCCISRFIHNSGSFLPSMHWMAIIYYCHIFSFSLNSYLICNVAVLVGGCIGLVLLASREWKVAVVTLCTWGPCDDCDSCRCSLCQMVGVIRSHCAAMKSATTDRWSYSFKTWWKYWLIN